MQIDLNKLIFPADDLGNNTPLPKQAAFIELALDAKGPQCLAYFGGVGSGKSVILCGTILSQAILHGGEYVLARQYMPELRRTTMKTMLEMIPEELLVEYRVADAEIHVKSASGKPAVIYCVGLDEPNKLLSLNLSGAGIDEASEVSQESFLLLLNRLRNKKGLRKILCVGNPRGHNWVYNLFIQKKGLKNPDNYHMIFAPTTENKHLPEGYVQNMLDSYSPERIKRDVYGSFDSFEGQVYSEFDRTIHVVRPFRIPWEWKRHIRQDAGYRNPAATLFFAISPDGEVYVYRELYVREWLIKEIILGDKKSNPKKFGILDTIRSGEVFETVKIDPSVKQRRAQTGESDYAEYMRHWPEHLPPWQLARNAVELGIDRVKQYLKPHPKTGKPLMYIFDTCVNLLEEISTYKYPELRANEQGNKAEKENPVKVNDHALDALRYMILDLPAPYTAAIDEAERRSKFTNIELAFQDEIANMRKPKEKGDPYGDGI